MEHTDQGLFSVPTFISAVGKQRYEIKISKKFFRVFMEYIESFVYDVSNDYCIFSYVSV